MRIAVSGATGLIGSELVRVLTERGDQAIALTRNVDRARGLLADGVESVEWADPQRVPAPAAALEGTDAIVHLLGEPIAQRWSEETKRKIRDSRVLGTRNLIAGIEAVAESERPRALVSQSATGYYGPRDDEPLDESAAPGHDFLAEVTAAWEHEALQAPESTRVVVARTGVVLSPSGGALAKMLPPFRLGVGGPVAGGKQYVPWIHLDDVVGGLIHCIDDVGLSGAVNLTAPAPVTNGALSHALGRVLHRPAVFPVPGFAVHLLYGEMSSVVTTGQRVIPRQLTESGYTFAHPELEGALRDVLGRAG
jgi:uncharacterized protein (TIGR01777 family)